MELGKNSGNNTIKYIHGRGYRIDKGILTDLQVSADDIAELIDKGYKIEIQPKEIKDKNILYTVDMKEFVFNGIQDRIDKIDINIIKGEYSLVGVASTGRNLRITIFNTEMAKKTKVYKEKDKELRNISTDEIIQYARKGIVRNILGKYYLRYYTGTSNKG